MTSWKLNKTAKPKHSKRHTKRIIPQGSGMTFSGNRYGHYTVTHDNGKDIYIQTDYDRPGLASSFGWNGRVPIRIKEEYPDDETGAEIAAATEYLDKNDGKRVEANEYFGNDQ